MKFFPIRKCEYVHLPVAVNGNMTNGELQDKIAEILSYAEPFQIYKFILSGKKSPDIEFDVDKILAMDQVLKVVDETVPDYDFDKLKQEYEDQMIGRFIRSMEQKGTDALVQKAMYYGVDALCKTMRGE